MEKEDKRKRRADIPPNRIRELRMKHGWTVQDLANFIGRDKGLISKYETHKRPVPIECVESLCRLFRCHRLEIFHRVDDEGQIIKPD